MNTLGALGQLPAFTDTGEVYVIIETPKGSRNKYAYDEEHQVFLLKGVMPEGMSFPYDYGYIPSTIGGDGDPLDMLVLMDAPAFPGCVITARVIGAITAEQTERDGRRERNDRLIGVASHAHTHGHVEALSDLRPKMIEEIEAFFEQYNRLTGKAFCPTGRSGATEALALVRSGARDTKRA
ncbi:inorganic diphosphatase [Methylobacterium sp. WSM2598]|uniref:inorganic diphosphatase n=1 Tax=Methylobacterium sp. WSM2598 TaxID=398261 RepID=UPI0003757C6E|nr:inorganic diphosphatase [Methylobacterium sp. WSM2598]